MSIILPTRPRIAVGRTTLVQASVPGVGFENGHRKLGGRGKGTPNHINGEIKETIREALRLEGGVEYLRR